MGRKYQQLSLENRCEIARLQADGCSIRQIAAALDRAPSTISREAKRNRGRHIGYKPSYAQEQTQARRWAGSRLEHEPELRRDVLERLASGWSPEQVAGRLAPQQGRRSRRRASARAPQRLACAAAPNHHLRQWHRVRPSSVASSPRHQNLLLRSLRALAEGRYRKRHRSYAPLHPTQN